jgi:PHP family Zn ribbon phosphoesterase
MSARYALALCESCDGSGETEAESHRMDCPDCLGTGYEEPQKRILNLIIDLIEAGKKRDDWMKECETNMALLKLALEAGDQAIRLRDTYAAALREIMINEEGLHRMGYNPYLIASAALKGGQHE